MPAAFPLSLRTIIRSGKSRSQPAAFSLAEPRRGYAYAQAIGTDTPVFWDVTFKFTQSEAALFQLWFTQTIQRGLLEFTLPIKTEFGLITHTCRFLPDGLLPVQEDGEVWVYSAKIMARAQIIPAEAIAQYGAAFTGPIPDLTSYATSPFSAALAGYWTGGVGPFTYALVAGSLPPGITLNTSTGALSGTTTAEDATVNAGLIVRRFGAYGLSIDSNAFTFTASATSAPVDLDLDKLVLKIEGEGSNGSTSISDTSPEPKSLTNSGITITTAQQAVGASSLNFDGSGFLRVNPIPGAGPLKLSDQDYTINGWVRADTIGSVGRYIFVQSGANTANFPYLYIAVLPDGRLRALVQPFVGATTPTFMDSAVGLVGTAAWGHFELGRVGTNAYLFWNGTLVASSTTWQSYPDSNVENMAYGHNANGYEDATFGKWTGQMDQLQIWKGVCKHTTSFTPPTV